MQAVLFCRFRKSKTFLENLTKEEKVEIGLLGLLFYLLPMHLLIAYGGLGTMQSLEKKINQIQILCSRSRHMEGSG